MIHVDYTHDEHHVLTIDGHANYDAVGHDIVCAAVSILAYTLAENLDRLGAECTCDLRVGAGYIRCYSESNAVSMAFEFAMCGLEMLEQSYPDFVHVDRDR